MVQGGKFGSDTNFTTQEIKQELVTEYIKEHPDESDRQVAENTPVSQPTVGKIRRGEGEDEEETEGVENNSGESVSTTEQADSDEEPEESTPNPSIPKVEATPVGTMVFSVRRADELLTNN